MENNEEPNEIDAIGFFGDGVVSAISIITASLASRCGIASEVKLDLEKALKAMLKGDPVDKGNAVAQHALQETIQLLEKFEKVSRPTKM